MAPAPPETHKPLYQRLYLQVLTAIVVGALLGHFFPAVGVSLKPLGEGFIKLIKMMIAPIVFATVTVGIAKMGHMSQVGRVGLKALLYFEVVSSVALVIGLVVVNVIKPGAGVNATVASLDPKDVEAIASTAKPLGTVDFVMNIIPTSVVDAFAKGEILQVLLFSVLFGLALLSFGEKGAELVKLIDQLSHALFGVIAILMKFAPIGAFGAMAFTIGKYGVHSLVSLGELMGSVYLTCILFVFLVLGGIARLAGFSIWKLIVYLKEEILIVLGTSSSESALPRMMSKLENLGCARPVVGLVIPTGYSFNLDGTSIYLTMAAIFVAQATNTPLSLGQQLSILGVLLLTSKGAAAVTGGGFITLAATLSTTHTIPVAGLAMLLGIDRFMSEARAITNLIGNGVATIVIAKWEKGLDAARMARVLDGETDLEADSPERVVDARTKKEDLSITGG
jgi:aerobic C4-dicarboxylate transport protein